MGNDRKLTKQVSSEYCPEPRPEHVAEFAKPQRYRKTGSGKIEMLCRSKRADGQLCTRTASASGRCTTPGHGGQYRLHGEIQPRALKWANPLWLEYKRRKLDRVLRRMGKLDQEKLELRDLVEELKPELRKLIEIAKSNGNGKAKRKGKGFQADENMVRLFGMADKLWGRIIQLEEAEGKIRRMVGSDVTLEDFAAVQRLYKMWILGKLEETRPRVGDEVVTWLKIQKKKGLLTENAMPEEMAKSLVSRIWAPIQYFRRAFAHALKMGELLTPRMKQLMRPDPSKGDVIVPSRKDREAESIGHTD